MLNLKILLALLMLTVTYGFSQSAIHIFIKDKSSKVPIKAFIELNKDTIKIKSDSTDEKGYLRMDSVFQDQEILVFSNDAYLIEFYSLENISDNDTIEISISKKRVYIGHVIKGFYFDHNSFELNPDSRFTLEKIKELCNTISVNDSMVILVKGKFSVKEKKKIKGEYLSYKRAKAVKDYLAACKNLKVKISYSRLPEQTGNTEEEHALSRCAEFELTSDK